MIDLSVKRPIGTIMFYVGIILLGIISVSKLSINLLPDLSYPKISVVTDYPGLGPEEIERFITSELEGPLSSISGVKKINSVSKDGLSIITLEFHWGTDMDFALLHTKERVEEVRSHLPDDHTAPVILEWDPSSAPIITAILKSEKRSLKKQKETAEFLIKPRLEQLEGVSRVEIRGGDDEEISVEIDPEKASSLNISLSEIAQAIKNNNEFAQGGTVKKDKFRYTLKIEGEIKSPEDIEFIVVKNLGDRSIMVKDIGRAFYKNKVKQGNIKFIKTEKKELREKSDAIALLIYRESGSNTVDATNNTIKTFKELEKEFNGEVTFFTIQMEADLIISSINSLKSSLILGGLLAFLILLLFLQNFRDPFMVSIVIPISIISTFVLMFAFDVNVNIMSLGGLVLGVGMFVDNSIIVLESIFRHRKSENLVNSVIEGTKEVSGAITASTFTTISIFLPVIYLYGITGKLFRDQALTVSFSLVSSLFVAITLLPALSAFKATFKIDFSDDIDKIEKKKWYHLPLKGLNFLILLPFQIIGYMISFVIGGLYILIKTIIKYLLKGLNFVLKPLYHIFNAVYTKFDNFYHNILEKILDKKSLAAILILTIIIAILGSFVMLRKELLPTPDTAKFEILANTIPAYGFEETNNIAQKIEEKLLDIEGVDFVYSETGSVSKEAARSEEISVNSIHFVIECNSNKHRPGVMDNTRTILSNADLLDYSIFLEKNTLSKYLSTSGENYQIKVFYEDIMRGKEAVDLILGKIKGLEGLYDVKSTTSPGKPVYEIHFKQELLNRLNITKAQISSFLNQAVKGGEAGTLKLIQKNYDIFVRVPVTGIMEVGKLMSLQFPINDHVYYIKDLIEIKERPSIKKISRELQMRYFLISGNVKGIPLDEVITKTESRLEDIDLPLNTYYSFAGEEEERRKAFDSLNQAIWLAIILVYMIMAAKFENIVQPLIIMFTVPMGLIGAFLFLLIFGYSLNIISGIGIMVLIGIGVNDAIVKIEYSNQLRREGKGVRDAIMTASRVRLRPILMTTFTTIFGVLPMGLIKQTGSELQQPLALVIIGGLFFTTFLTLLLIPVFYEILEEYKEKRKVKA
ncbi:MAG: efflux RND transporter permease subunit [Acidobacteriota bacterium]